MEGIFHTRTLYTFARSLLRAALSKQKTASAKCVPRRPDSCSESFPAPAKKASGDTGCPPLAPLFIQPCFRSVFGSLTHLAHLPPATLVVPMYERLTISGRGRLGVRPRDVGSAISRNGEASARGALPRLSPGESVAVIKCGSLWQVAVYGWFTIITSRYARISLMTRPCTSVNRMSRPLKR